MIKNPILPGFNPDPCIIRKGDDYYIATSTFEWFPGVAIYHSRDLERWSLLTHALTDEETLDLRMLPSAKGVWAPCLTWCERDGLFYLLYTRMISHNARFFDMDNFLVTAPDILGPWSEPTYLHSIGFDPSLFHDDGGKKYVVSLEWETRDGYEKPGVIALQEYDPVRKEVVGFARRIWTGGTDRGCIEGPHIYKRNGFYYIMTAEGGTGYGHAVAVGRSSSIWGPYERDPQNPILSAAGDFYGRDDDGFLKSELYNGASPLQKTGHGSLVETRDGRWYLAHLCARPFLPELRCTLGRETALQEMKWTDDGWIRLASGGNRPSLEAPSPGLPPAQVPDIPVRQDFDSGWDPQYIAPRTDWKKWSSMTERKGFLRIHGQQSLCSLDRVSLIARRLTSLNASFSASMEFEPSVWQQSAGMVAYYDNMNWIFLRVYLSERLGSRVLDLMRVENGERRELPETAASLPNGANIFLRCTVKDRSTRFWYSLSDPGPDVDAFEWTSIGPDWDTSLLSDEYCKYGEFTGTFVGVCCVDSNRRDGYADFDWVEYRDN